MERRSCLIVHAFVPRLNEEHLASEGEKLVRNRVCVWVRGIVPKVCVRLLPVLLFTFGPYRPTESIKLSSYHLLYCSFKPGVG